MSIQKICILPLGKVDRELIRVIGGEVESTFGFDVEILPNHLTPAMAFNAARGQYSSTGILRRLSEFTPSEALKILSVTNKDLYVVQMSYVFGEAMVDGPFSVISTARLDPEFYGEPHDDALFIERTIKEAVHELGHTFGLHHCRENGCVMVFSSNITDTDHKSAKFCARCGEQLAAKLDDLNLAA